jgi:carboxypeptidase C (cathepsin A)
LYSGQNDACVSSPGLQTFLNSWNWSMKDNWKRAKKEILKVGDRVYGWRKQYSRLTFALVNNAGHFVPADQPIGFYSMFSEWLLM